jgi:hypothetical protein
MPNRCLGELSRRSPDVWQSAGRAIELGARLPLLPLAARGLLIVCGPTAGYSQGAHDQRRLDTVHKDAGVSVLHHRHLPSGYLDASRGRQAPPGQPTRQRSCRPSAAARARGLPTTSTSSSPATSAAGLATRRPGRSSAAPQPVWQIWPAPGHDRWHLRGPPSVPPSDSGIVERAGHELGRPWPRAKTRAARTPNREVRGLPLHDGVPAGVARCHGACAWRGRCPR